eukprot:2800059-Rhodomonas_salina.1
MCGQFYIPVVDSSDSSFYLSRPCTKPKTCQNNTETDLLKYYTASAPPRASQRTRTLQTDRDRHSRQRPTRHTSALRHTWNTHTWYNSTWTRPKTFPLLIKTSLNQPASRLT